MKLGRLCKSKQSVYTHGQPYTVTGSFIGLGLASQPGLGFHTIPHKGFHALSVGLGIVLVVDMVRDLRVNPIQSNEFRRAQDVLYARIFTIKQLNTTQ